VNYCGENLERLTRGLLNLYLTLGIIGCGRSICEGFHTSEFKALKKAPKTDEKIQKIKNEQHGKKGDQHTQ